MPNAHPIVLSLLVCDGVHVDPISGKTYLLGSQAALGGAGFPRVHPILCVALDLTNGHGRTPLSIRFVRSHPERMEGEEIAGVGFELDFPSPRDDVSLRIEFPEIEFPVAGHYRVLVECGGLALLERGLLVE